MKTLNDYISKASKLGTKAGSNSAEWATQNLWGGRSGSHAQECAESVLKRLEDGDPGIYDSFSLPDLSGEWADEQNQNDLFWQCCGYEYDPEIWEHQEIMEEISQAWEQAVGDSFFSTLEKSARDFLS